MTATVRRCLDSAGASGGGTTRSVTLSSLNANDDVLVATFTTGAQTITGVSDGTNTYAKIASGTGTAGTCELWAALNVAASATPKTITATWSGTAPFASIWAADVAYLVTSGLLDHTAQTTGTAQVNLTGPNLTSTAAAEMQIVLVIGAGPPLTGSTNFPWQLLTSTSMHANGFGVGYLAYNTTLNNQFFCNQTSNALYVILAVSLNTQAASSWVVNPLTSVTSFSTKSPGLVETAPRPSYVYSTDSIPNTFRRPTSPTYNYASPAFSTFRPPVDVRPPSTVGAASATALRVPYALQQPEYVAVLSPAMPNPATEGQIWPPPQSGSVGP